MGLQVSDGLNKLAAYDAAKSALLSAGLDPSDDAPVFTALAGLVDRMKSRIAYSEVKAPALPGGVPTTIRDLAGHTQVAVIRPDGAYDLVLDDPVDPSTIPLLDAAPFGGPAGSTTTAAGPDTQVGGAGNDVVSIGASSSTSVA